MADRLRKAVIPVIAALLAAVIAGCASPARSEEAQLIRPEGEDAPADNSGAAKETAPETESGGRTSLPDLVAVRDTIPAEYKRPVYLILPGGSSLSKEEQAILTDAVLSGGGEAVLCLSEGDAELQSRFFREAVDAKAALIVCDNTDEEATASAALSAARDGIPVILLGRGIDTMGIASYQALTEYYSPVSELGRDFAAMKDSAANFVELMGGDTEKELNEAFLAAFAGKKGMRLLGTAIAGDTHTESYSAIWEVLRAAPETDTVICGNAAQTEAALEAAEDLGKKLTVFCLCGDRDSIAAYVEEGRVAEACVKPSADLARAAAPVITAYLRDGTLPHSECEYVRAQIVRAEGQ